MKVHGFLHWLKIKLGYRKHHRSPIFTVTEPVRQDGKPAKHLEVMQTKHYEHVTDGWRKKKTRSRLHVDGIPGDWRDGW